MRRDPGMEPIRAIREQISHEHGNDPRRLVAHYMQYQKRFADRLRRAPGLGEEPGVAGKDAATDDSVLRRY